jgi:preprotein translocase subunit Sss1
MPRNTTTNATTQYHHHCHPMPPTSLRCNPRTKCILVPPIPHPPTHKGLITKQGVAVNFTGGAQGLAILAVTNAQYRDSIVFSGLIEDTKDRFLSKGYMWSSASAGSLSKKFKGDLSDLCKEYDDEKSKNKIARLREQVGVVQQTMQTNISKALDNLESTESLEASSENLVASSEAFHRGAKKLAWKEWLMLMKMRFLIFLVFVVIIGIIIAVVCADNACAAKDDPGTGGGAVAAGPAASANRL